MSHHLSSVTNSIGMELMLIPAGMFMMRSPDSDAEATDAEKPAHRVTISQLFYRTRSQGQNVRVDQLLLEPGEIGLLPIKEAADRIDQNMVGRRCSQTTGLFE
jgi:hypothetical protein